MNTLPQHTLVLPCTDLLRHQYIFDEVFASYLCKQAKDARETLEARVAALEAIVASMQPAVTAAVDSLRADTPVDEGS